jgi:hypothetical protein
MLTLTDVETLLERFTYKPNVEFSARSVNPWDNQGLNPYGLNTIMVRAVMWTLNSHESYPSARELMGIIHGMNGLSDTPIQVPDGIYGRRILDLRPIKVAQCGYVPEFIMERATLDEPKPFWDWLIGHVIPQLEHHEIDEWAKVDGVPLNDPHTKGRAQ